MTYWLISYAAWLMLNLSGAKELV